MASSGKTDRIFVGRQREMDGLRAALDESITGHGRLALMVGEPGIGKTRTAEELAAYAETRGAQILWGRCYEEDGAPPYWPWVQAIRSYVEPRNTDQLQADLGSSAADIAEIVPEIRRKLTGLETPTDLPPEQARFRLFDSITSFLKTTARSQPLMLVLDDLHWADEPSLLLLQFLAQQLADSSILVVGCYRDVELSRQHPLSETLARISREAVYQRHALRRMDHDDTAHFIEVAAGTNVSRTVVEAIYARTEGNPFFTTEVVQLLSDRGELAQESDGGPGEIRIPEGVREVIGQRFNRLSDDCNLVLSTAAVIGREFTLDLLGRLIEDLAGDRLLEVLEEALSAHLLDELPTSMGRYQFTHALIQETLTDELSLTRRVRLHARIAETLEELYGPEVEDHAAELAYHFGQGEPVLGSDKLVHYSLLAGKQALAAYAYEDGADYFARGLTARGITLLGTEPASDEEAADLMFGLASAKSTAGGRDQLEEVLANLHSAFNHYALMGNISQAVAAAELPLVDNAVMKDIIERGLTMVAPDSHEAGRLLSRYAVNLGRSNSNYDGAQNAFSQALAIARREGDQALEMKTLAAAATVAYAHLREDETLERSRSAIDLARRIDDPWSEVTAHFFAVGAHYTLGNLEEADRHATEAIPVAERLNAARWLGGAFWRKDILCQLVGDWQTARRFSDRGLSASGRASLLLCTRVLLEYETGEFSQGESYMDQLLGIMEAASPATSEYAFSTLVMLFVDRITGESKWTDAAEKAAQRTVDAVAHPMGMLTARVGLGLVAVSRGETGPIKEQYRYLKDYRGIVLPGTLRSTDRLLGILSRGMGDIDQSTQHFEDALAFCRKAGYRPELAWTCCDYADTLCLRLGAGDREKAAALLDESLAIATVLGMRPLMERVTDRLGTLETQPVAKASYPDGLTQREVEVLRLLAEGKSNSQIALELVVAEGTTRRHVANIYEKIDVANRTEATRYALREGLLSLDESSD